MKPFVVVSLCAALAACASQPMPPPNRGADMGRAIQQPIRDLSLIRDRAPDVLLRALADPYAADHAGACTEVIHEIAALDDALGPDLKPGGEKKSLVSADSLAADLVGGAVGLPFRGVVRQITGAEKNDRALKNAVLAGMVRRGYLKGRLSQMTCEPVVHAG